jgi:assimilatory nitrate reductase catalytic subunit
MGDRALLIDGDRTHPASGGRLCARGARSGEAMGLEGRLLYPEIAGRRAGWDRAIKLVAKRLTETIARHGPDSVAFLLSGRLLTEDLYVANKLMKGYIGSANIDVDAQLSSPGVVAGHIRAFGEDVVPATYEDLDRADLIVLVGTDTASRYPMIHDRIVAARAEREGALVVIGPGSMQACSDADLHLAIAPGSEGILMNGLLAFCDRAGVIDRDFLDRSVVVPEGFWEGIGADHDIWSVARRCDVSPALLKQYYQLFAATPNTITLFDDKGDRINAILNVHLATGRIGKAGAAPFCLASEPNAMGVREVGATPLSLAAHMDFGEENVARTARFWAASNMATRPGVGAVELFQQVQEGRIKALWVMASDPAASPVYGEQVREALALCPFIVTSECLADTGTGRLAHVKLPAACWGEKDGTATNANRLISRQRALVPLPEEVKPDWWILTQVARAMGWRESFTYDRPADIHREHARLSAYQNDGRRLFNLKRHASMSNPAYDELTPWRWGEVPFDGGHFPTKDGKARLVPG